MQKLTSDTVKTLHPLLQKATENKNQNWSGIRRSPLWKNL